MRRCRCPSRLARAARPLAWASSLWRSHNRGFPVVRARLGARRGWEGTGLQFGHGQGGGASARGHGRLEAAGTPWPALLYRPAPWAGVSRPWRPHHAHMAAAAQSKRGTRAVQLTDRPGEVAGGGGGSRKAVGAAHADCSCQCARQRGCGTRAQGAGVARGPRSSLPAQNASTKP